MDITSLDYLLHNNPTIWVFGYGSLLWKPDFEYSSKKIGSIKGFVRRFWQGNSTHRGTPSQPGRVANLVKCKEGRAWGVAYEIKGTESVTKALTYLNVRETQLGGYSTLVTEFEPREQGSEPFSVLVFTVTEDNQYYLGETDIPSMAKQIVTARGAAGTNVEYVTKIADYVRHYVPEDKDDHLFTLDLTIRKLVREMVGSDESTEWHFDMHRHNLLTREPITEIAQAS
ncbi:putative glutathione-specific gamma-glutamylcyclotransferase 2 [Haliotis cracherodii]|uniref:putative glutathione-specific gamma-glutamylcyclotransferase 2 n=1 Tax=Haliotis rufescens TaxID=6454 RepID=UPI001EAFC08D|nr:putative glutathione-specific gamma-glutamylcyclotransferase 2 [Haliotis rufescens]